MSEQFGVSISHYGGASWSLAALERELARQDIRILEIRGCAYPEMARSEQVRQARLAGLETLVFVDGHVEVTVDELRELVAVADEHGVAVSSDEDHPWALECAAVRRDVIEAIVQAEARTYGNSAVDALWSGEKVAAVPIANPWKRNGSPLVPGEYLSDSQAFLHRAKAVGAVIARHHPGSMRAHRKTMKMRVSNANAPITNEPGSHFALCVPSFGALDLDQQASLFALERAGMMVLGLHDCPWIDMARSWLSEQALEQGRGVFFIDHDIMFHPNDVLRLCEQALERNAVVGAAYCMRKSGKNIIGSFDLPPGPVTFFEGGATHPAYYSGLGFAAVPANVLESIELPRLTCHALALGIGRGVAVRPWYALDCSTGFYAGEDVSFCNRVHDLAVDVRDSGIEGEPQWGLSHSGREPKVFLDSRVRIAHRGVYDYGIEDAGIVVPRIHSLTTHMTASRKEARDILMNAAELPVDVKLDMQDFAEA